MMRLTSKLRLLKSKLKTWSKTHYSQLSEKTAKARENMDRIQTEIQQRPLDLNLAELENRAIKEYTQLAKDEEASLRQKATAKNIQLGDQNNGYFHRLVQSRKSCNKIFTITDENNALLETDADIKEGFLAYYKSILGTEHLHPYSAETVEQMDMNMLGNEEELAELAAD
ncbi:hypothetical protein FRX31_031545, partial [Thalictrum thalictroides]